MKLQYGCHLFRGVNDVRGRHPKIRLDQELKGKHLSLYFIDTTHFLLQIIRSEQKQPLLILISFVVIGFVLACYLYNLDNLALLYYSDSVSHLVRARQLIDYSSPGLGQIGTVWLPLPHLILLPFSLIDPLFETGFAGTLVSLPSLALTAAILYMIIRELTDTSSVAFLGACLYFLNPNILYLGMTAMTESLFMLFFVISGFYLQKVFSTKTLSFISSDLLKCSFFVVLATLCRYEAWPLTIFLALITALYTLRVRIFSGVSVVTKNRLLAWLVCTALSLSGVLLWILYNWTYYGDPLEFLISPYYSAAAQALEGNNRDFLVLQPLNAASLYGVTAVVFFGPLVTAGAILGYIVHRRSALRSNRNRDMIILFFAIPPLFSYLTLVLGIGEMNYWWFNSRFIIILSPLLIVLLSFLVRSVTKARLKNTRISEYAIIAILLVYPIFVLPMSGEIVTLIDAKNSVSYGTRPSAMEIAKVLGDLYEEGNVLLITGSAQQNIIMHASGIPLTKFYGAIEEFYCQIQQFELDSDYVILSKDPDPSSQTLAKGWTERKGELRKDFEKIYENDFYVLFARNSL